MCITKKSTLNTLNAVELRFSFLLNSSNIIFFIIIFLNQIIDETIYSLIVNLLKQFFYNFQVYSIFVIAALVANCQADDSVLDNVKKEILDFGHVVGDKVGKAVDTVKDHLSDAKDSVSDHAKDAKDAIADKVDDGGSFFENMGKGIRDAMHTVGEKFGEATDYIGEKIGVIKPKSDAEKAMDRVGDELKNIQISRFVRAARYQ